MWTSLNGIASWVAALLLQPVQTVSWVWQVTLLALPVTVLALLAFRLFSNQTGIRRVQRRIQAYLLEMRLFRDDLRIVARAQGRIFGLSLRYLMYALPPLVVMIVPIVLVLAQVETRFAYRPLATGETAMLIVALDEPVTTLPTELVLPAGVGADTAALRIDSRREIRWQLRAVAPGTHAIRIRLGERWFERPLAVGTQAGLVVPAVFRADDPRTLFAPELEPLLPGQPVNAIEIRYPRALSEFAGLSSASWALFALTMLFGFLLRGRFGVAF